MRNRMFAMLVAAAAPLVGPAVAHAQAGLLDEGTYRLLVNGQEVGTETFSIRQSGSGERAVVIAQGRVVLDGSTGTEQLTSSLQVAGVGLRPAAYNLEVAGAEEERIAGRVASGRFSARIVGPSGERMREYLVSDGAVIVDDGVAHHYYFLAQRAGSDRVPVVIPRDSRQVWATVASQGDTTIEVAGRSVTARHLRVQIEGGDARDIWVDAQGRVLRLAVPARNFVAERVALPA